MTRYLFNLSSYWILFMLCAGRLAAQTEMPLYPNKIPNAKESPNQETLKDGVARKVSLPTLTAFLPGQKTANGSAVIICPGGGYGVLVIDREGYRLAKALNAQGVAASVF